jgi:hypothetical protein
LGLDRRGLPRRVNEFAKESACQTISSVKPRARCKGMLKMLIYYLHFLARVYSAAMVDLYHYLVNESSTERLALQHYR